MQYVQYCKVCFINDASSLGVITGTCNWQQLNGQLLAHTKIWDYGWFFHVYHVIGLQFKIARFCASRRTFRNCSVVWPICPCKSRLLISMCPTPLAPVALPTCPCNSRLFAFPGRGCGLLCLCHRLVAEGSVDSFSSKNAGFWKTTTLRAGAWGHRSCRKNAAFWRWRLKHVVF